MNLTTLVTWTRPSVMPSLWHTLDEWIYLEQIGTQKRSASFEPIWISCGHTGTKRIRRQVRNAPYRDQACVFWVTNLKSREDVNFAHINSLCQSELYENTRPTFTRLV